MWRTTAWQCELALRGRLAVKRPWFAGRAFHRFTSAVCKWSWQYTISATSLGGESSYCATLDNRVSQVTLGHETLHCMTSWNLNKCVLSPQGKSHCAVSTGCRLEEDIRTGIKNVRYGNNCFALDGQLGSSNLVFA